MSHCIDIHLSGWDVELFQGCYRFHYCDFNTNIFSDVFVLDN